MSDDNIVYLLTGSNIGNKSVNLDEANKAIGRHIGTVLKVSGIYRTEAWGIPDQPVFLNQALQVATALDVYAVLAAIDDIEKSLGRKRYQKWGPRSIDIDILAYNDLVLDDESLTIPHHELPNRKFALVPLQEIHPDFIHPVSGKDIQTLITESKDPLAVECISSSSDALQIYHR